jgi:hypothetical protein
MQAIAVCRGYQCTSTDLIKAHITVLIVLICLPESADRKGRLDPSTTKLYDRRGDRPEKGESFFRHIHVPVLVREQQKKSE